MMINFTYEEKCAMMVAITPITSIEDSRNEARIKIMLRYQDMLGIGNFEMVEYANTKKDTIVPTLQAMSVEKKKFFTMIMLTLIIEDKKIDDAERKLFLSLVTVCCIPETIVKEAMHELLGNNC